MKLEMSKRIFNGVKPESAAGTAKQGKETSAASWQIILQHQQQLAEEYLKKTENENSGKELKKAILDKYSIHQNTKQKLKN